MLLKLDNTRVLFYFLCITGTVLVSKSSWDLSLHYLSPEESSVCACHKCLTDGDPWFMGLFNASPAAFLSRKIRTSENAFNWWKRMQYERRNYGVFNRTVDMLFKMFPPSPDVVGPSPDRCRTCAVVGNSGNLKGSRYGPLIDYHDIVIRMNHAPIKGYEADVGTKTTHHVMYPVSAVKLDNKTRLVFFPFKIKDFEWLLKTFNLGENSTVNSKTIANKNLVMILNPAFMKYVHEMWLGKKGRYPSTGFLTLVLSMQMCDVVSVFGFGADGNGNWSHYFEILHNKKLRTGQHAGTHEYKLIQQLHQRQKIHFFKGF